MPSTDLLRAWVADRVTELEGLRDDVLIDMVMRRIEEDSDWDRQSFEASVSILMGERAQGFTAALWTYLGRNDDGTSQSVPPPSTVERVRPTAAPLPQSVLDGGGGQGGVGSVVGPQQPQATGGGGRGGYQDGEGEGQDDEEHYEDEEVDFEEADDYDNPRYGDGDGEEEEGEEEDDDEYYDEEYADEAVANGDALPTPPGGGDAASAGAGHCGGRLRGGGVAMLGRIAVVVAC